jgi:hypothetical protein
MEGNKTDKKIVTAAMVAYGEETLKLHEASCYCEFVNWYNDCCQANWPGCPRLRRDAPATCDKLRHLFPAIRREMEERHNVMAIKVNRFARELVEHGAPPTRDDRCNDAAWRRCLPRTGAEAVGVVFLTQDSLKGHPVLAAEIARLYGSAATRLRGAEKRNDRANGLGLLSNRDHDKLRKPALVLAQEIITPSLPFPDDASA